MELNPTLLAVGIWLGGLLVGGSIIASGQVFLALREIALNTRSSSSDPSADERKNYGVLSAFSHLHVILGFLIIAAAIVLGAGILASPIQI